jgi:ribonuclease PH
VQGTAEHKLFDRKLLDGMLDGGLAAIQQLTAAQAKVLG